MRKILTITACFFFATFGVGSNTNSKPEPLNRIIKNINREWRFTLESPVNQPFFLNFNDSSWDKIGLPHSFSIPYFRSDKFFVGYGWYRKNLKIEKEWISRNIELEFDGVFQVAEIYLNGEKVGEHHGGYTGFTVDISKMAKAGDNCLAIKVNNIWNPELAPRAGEHVFSGGIYRDVYLIITNPLHISWNGIFVSTPSVSSKEATVSIKTEVKNSTTTQKSFMLKTIICDSLGHEIEVIKTLGEIKAGTILEIAQISQPIKNPKLWSPDFPYLYKVKTIIYEGDTAVDNYQTPMGIRWFDWTSDKGLFLNGKHLYLEGVNVHQDHAGWGDAVTKAGIYRDIKLMKDAGFNLIRGSHYPHHPYFAQVCDQLGMIFLSENCFWGIGGFKDDGSWDSSAYPVNEKNQDKFENSVKRSLSEMILINRNSPSIIAWSMSNEPFFTNQAVMDKMKVFLKSLSELSEKIDPTRPALIGGAQRNGVDTLGTIAGYNGDGATLYKSPGFASLVSEYGSCVTDRPGDYIPCWGDVKDGAKPLWRSGHAIWCGFDHGSIAGKMGMMGIVDFYRIPKRSWYWYRNYHLKTPPPEWPVKGIPNKLKLFADKNTIKGTDATDDVHLNVQVYGVDGKHISNSPDVTLTIVSGPGEFPTGRSITFTETLENNIKILDGHAAIEFRSYEAGKSIIKATSSGLKEATIEIVTTGEPQYKNGITPVVKNRPYIDYATVELSQKMEVVNISRARPTKSNSSSKSKPSNANDGDFNTIWEPTVNGRILWWQLDMENFYHVANVKLNFTERPYCEIKVEISEDQSFWKEFKLIKKEEIVGSKVELATNNKLNGRFLKVTLSPIDNNNKIKLQEIEVLGKAN